MVTGVMPWSTLASNKQPFNIFALQFQIFYNPDKVRR